MNGDDIRDVLNFVELETSPELENVKMETTALGMHKKIENATLYHVVNQ